MTVAFYKGDYKFFMRKIIFFKNAIKSNLLAQKFLKRKEKTIVK